MIRVSTTTLESYRRVISTEYGSEAELIANIKGEPFERNWKMDAGSEWDKLVQNTAWPDGRTRFGNGHTFDLSAIQAAQKHIGAGVWQAKAAKIIEGVNVVAQVDHIRGTVIQENKAKFSQPDAKDYETSLQWRFYLLVHDASVCRYNLFDFNDPKDGYCELTNILSFKFWPYRSLEADCRRWLFDFMAWAEQRKLVRFLNRESSTAEAA